MKSPVKTYLSDVLCKPEIHADYTASTLLKMLKNLVRAA
jgi:hypothetical protein